MMAHVQQKGMVHFIRNNPFALALGVVLGILYLYFFGFRALVQLDIEVESPYPSFFKIYWAADGQGFSEKNMRQIRIKPNRSHYRFYLTDLGNVERLRIDPLEYPGTVKLKKLSFDQTGFEEVTLENKAQWVQLKPIQQSELGDFTTLEQEGSGQRLQTLGRDGQFELKLTAERETLFPIVHVVILVLICGLVLIMANWFGFLFREYWFVPGALIIILALSATMAAVTELGVHPDERVHLAAVKYYGENFLPPPIDSPEIEDSFSGYGISRLANYEIYYQAAGYFSRLLSPFQLTSVFSARAFGLVLVLGLLMATIRSAGFRIFALPLLVSAQTWYLFSYTNSDGFALFLAMIAGYQIAHKESALNKLLCHEGGFGIEGGIAKNIVLFGSLVGMLLLSKTNFYFFFVFLGAYLLWRIAIGDFPKQKQLWIHLSLIGLVGLSVYGVRMGLDYAANGPDPGALKAQMIEQHADQIYKPSTPLNEKHIYLYLKERNFTLDRIINKEQWMGKTFVNAFGSYGFTEFLGSTSYYDLIKIVGAAIFALMFVGVLVNGPTNIQVLFALVALCALLLIGALLWRSWTISFQAQGRYLAPILPMLGIFYYHARQYIYERAIIGLVLGLFFIGLYSFVFVGLHDIPKTSYLN